MKEKLKYYTPKIKEFHYGFEFEYLQPMAAFGKKDEWIEHTFGKGMMDGIHLGRLSIGGWAVKYRKLKSNDTKRNN